MQLAPFKLERYFAKYEFNAEFLLCSSDCESLAIADLLAMEPGGAQEFQGLRLGYTESPGGPGLRREISKIYSSIDPAQVLVHSGAEEAIFLFMLAMLKENDHVIVHAPHYQSLGEVARALGCLVSPWRAREENGWSLDLDELDHLLRPSTRAVILNMPHNPTGALMAHADFEAVNRFVQDKGLILFSDEVYRESEYDAAARLPAACDLGEHAVSLGVTSKAYGLAGLRIGWIATKNERIYARMAGLKDYTSICNSAPSEFLAELALRHRGTLAGRNLEIILSNLAIVDRLFQRRAGRFSWVRPAAGSMGFPRLQNGEAEEFCDRLVREAGVLLLPGSVYGDYRYHFRLGLGRSNLPQAVARLEAFLGE